MWAPWLLITGMGSTVTTLLATFMFMVEHGRTNNYALTVILLLLLPQAIALSLGVIYLEDQQKEKRKTK